MLALRTFYIKIYTIECPQSVHSIVDKGDTVWEKKSWH